MAGDSLRFYFYFLKHTATKLKPQRDGRRDTSDFGLGTQRGVTVSAARPVGSRLVNCHGALIVVAGRKSGVAV
jgi:hypothetical protein